MRSARSGIHLARNVVHYGAQFGWFYAITLIPIGQVVAIEFTMPIWTALLAVYGDRAPQVLESRGSFFRFMVVAYNLAFGRRPASPRPLIVHQQHIWSDTNAQRLVADFSDCRFIHTVRDPISCLDSTVEHFADLNDPKFVAAQYDPACIRRPRFNYPAWNAFWALAWRDAPHAGLQDRSVSVRFEDLHAQPRQTMGRVARWLGLSEAGPGSLERACKVHPIAALQTEYSLWSRDPEDEILQTCRELGILFVAYSPLGRGFLTGRFKRFEDLAEDDFRRHSPRFQGENFQKNLDVVSKIEEMAASKGVTPSQLALAWVMAQGRDIVPIPGTKRVRYLEEDAAAAGITLTAQELERIAEISPKGVAAGTRYAPEMMRFVNM